MNFLDLDPRRSGCTDPRRGLAVLHSPSSTPSPQCPVAPPARVDPLAGNAASSTRPRHRVLPGRPPGMGPRCLAGPAVEDEISRSRADWAVGRRTTAGGVSSSAAARASLVRRVRSAVSSSADRRASAAWAAWAARPCWSQSPAQARFKRLGWSGICSGRRASPDERTRSAGRRPPMLPGVCLGRGALRPWQSGCRSR